MMSTVSEKLLQVAQNNPKVYHSGQLNIVKNAECLKGSKSGSAMLIDDVSPVEHDMGVKVRGKNLIPYPYEGLQNVGVTEELNGINFTPNADGSILMDGTANKGFAIGLYNNRNNLLGLKTGDVVTISKYVSDSSQVSKFNLLFSYWTSNAEMVNAARLGGNTTTATVTITDNFIGFNIYIYIPDGTVISNLLCKFQLELGTTATTYTPYVPDLTAVKVKRCGKNLLNQSTTELGTLKQGYAPTNIRDFEDNTWYAALAVSGYYDPNNRMPEYALNGESIKIKTAGTGGSREYYGLSKSLQCNPSTTYTLSYTMENGKTQNASGIGFYGADKKHISFVYCDSGSSFTTPSNCYWIIVCFHGNTEDTYVTYSDIQLELGTTATEYEPYITQTEYTSTADGTVNGVTSLYPNTTLTTDTDGVLIDCEYYKDIDKTFNELTTSVALSGGDS